MTVPSAPQSRATPLVLSLVALIGLALFGAWSLGLFDRARAGAGDDAGVPQFERRVVEEASDAVSPAQVSESDPAMGPDPRTPVEHAPEAERVRNRVESEDDNLVTVSGRVVDARTGQGLADVAVRARVALFPLPARTLRTTTDGEGRYVFDRVLPGRFVLRFRHLDFCTAVLRPRLIEAGQRVAFDDVGLYVGTVLRGTMRLDGRVRAGLGVHVVPLGDDVVRRPTLRSTLTGPDGSYVFPDRFPPGRYKVLVGPSALPPPLRRLRGSGPRAEQDIEPGGGRRRAGGVAEPPAVPLIPPRTELVRPGVGSASRLEQAPRAGCGGPEPAVRRASCRRAASRVPTL